MLPLAALTAGSAARASSPVVVQARTQTRDTTALRGSRSIAEMQIHERSIDAASVAIESVAALQMG
jgi:hypothetical protein